MQKAETAHKFEITNEQLTIFIVFGKSGNGSKIWGNGPKIWGNRTTNWNFLKFLKKAETNLKYEEMDLKFEETDQLVFEKKWKQIKNMRQRT